MEGVKKVVYNDKEYVKASEVAKKFKYTQDYVGQLCRSGKVDARLVGRSWYVELASVTAYRKQKHATQKKPATQKPKGNTAKTVTSAGKKNNVRVEPVDRSKTLRLVREKMATSGRNRRPVATYEPEEVRILPIITKQKDGPQKTNNSKVSLDTQDSKPKKIIVKTRKKKVETTFVSEKLPEVSLSGKLPVTDGAQFTQQLTPTKDKKRAVEMSTATARRAVQKPRQDSPATQQTSKQEHAAVVQAVSNDNVSTRDTVAALGNTQQDQVSTSHRRSIVVPALICGTAILVGFVVLQSVAITSVVSNSQGVQAANSIQVRW